MSAVGAGAETIVLRLLYQLIVILVATRVVVAVVRRFGQTDVSGEILAGLLLGPSCLGALAPEFMARLFHPSTTTIFVGLSQMGLVLLMFQIGMEFEFRATLGASKRSIVVISLAGLVVPFALGYFSAPWFWSQLGIAPAPSLTGFRLFFAVAMSITAIPILGRIFMELGLSHTRTAALTIGAAAVDDVTGWLLLGVVSLIVQGAFSTRWVAMRAAGLALYLAFVFLVARPLAKRAVARHLATHGGRLSPAAIGLIFIGLFVSAAITSNLGVFAIIGGFVVGVMLHDDRAFVAEWKSKVAPTVNTLLLPIFFTYTGLRTDIGLLGSAHEWLLCGLVCLVAFAGKFGGAYGGARFVGESRRSSLTIATCMNTRALMELIALNIGYDLGVLPRSMFTKLVIMAIVSTFMATPLIRWLMRAERRPDMLRGSSTEGTPCAASSP
ncbi:MAG: sodium:proton antiporter [bacterium]|nr:sodium:proton antiporter [bacterium]